MAIESYVTVTLASVELGNDYDAELTATDPMTMMEAKTSLTPDQADALAVELRAVAARARSARAEDDSTRASERVRHAFDVSAPTGREHRVVRS